MPQTFGKTTDKFVLIGLVTCYSLIVLSCLLHFPFWFDEVFTAYLSSVSFSSLLELLKDRISTPLYYVIVGRFLDFQETLGGTEELWARLPSFVAGVIGLLLFYATVRPRINKRFALVAALLLAVSSAYVRFGFEARFYEIIIVVSIASQYSLDRFLVDRQLKWLSIWTLASTVNVYLHYFTVVYIIGQGIYSIWQLHAEREHRSLPETRLMYRYVAAGSLSILILTIPLAIFASHQPSLWNLNPLDQWLHGRWKTLLGIAGTFGGYTVFGLGTWIVAAIGFFKPPDNWPTSYRRLSIVLFAVSLGTLIAWTPTLNPQYFLFGLPFFQLALLAGLLRIYLWSQQFGKTKSAAIVGLAVALAVGPSVVDISRLLAGLDRIHWKHDQRHFSIAYRDILENDPVILLADEDYRPETEDVTLLYYLDKTKPPMRYFDRDATAYPYFNICEIDSLGELVGSPILALVRVDMRKKDPPIAGWLPFGSHLAVKSWNGDQTATMDAVEGILREVRSLRGRECEDNASSGN